jgi:hypothetical protein
MKNAFETHEIPFPVVVLGKVLLGEAVLVFSRVLQGDDALVGDDIDVDVLTDLVRL